MDTGSTHPQANQLFAALLGACEDLLAFLKPRRCGAEGSSPLTASIYGGHGPCLDGGWRTRLCLLQRKLVLKVVFVQFQKSSSPGRDAVQFSGERLQSPHPRVASDGFGWTQRPPGPSCNSAASAQDLSSSCGSLAKFCQNFVSTKKKDRSFIPSSATALPAYQHSEP